MNLFKNPSYTWILFHGIYDLAYLIKLITMKKLPNECHSFYQLINYYFPYFHDIKNWVVQYTPYRFHSLSNLACELNVYRFGNSHLAGSDSLLTFHIFLELIKYFNRNGGLKYTQWIIKFNTNFVFNFFKKNINIKQKIKEEEVHVDFKEAYVSTEESNLISTEDKSSLDEKELSENDVKPSEKSINGDNISSSITSSSSSSSLESNIDQTGINLKPEIEFSDTSIESSLITTCMKNPQKIFKENKINEILCDFINLSSITLKPLKFKLIYEKKKILKKKI